MTPLTRFLWHIFLVFILILTSIAAHATIALGEVVPASAGQCDGSIEVIANGTAGPFFIEIIGTDGFSDFVEGVGADDPAVGSYSFTGLCSGDYTIYVANRFQCTTTLTTSLSCSLTYTSAVTPSCTPGGGSISITPEGGTAPYTYTWKDDAGTSIGSTQTVSDLLPGEYFVTITDANGCQGMGSFTTEPTGEDSKYPYIKSVAIYATDNGVETLIYEARWLETADGCLRFTGGAKTIPLALYDALTAGTVGLRIEASANKELNDNLNCSLLNSGGGVSIGSNDNVNWEMTVPSGVIFQPAGGKLSEIFFFDGTDMNGNPLLNLWSASNQQNDCVVLPTLQGDCTWTPTPASGSDEHLVQLERACMQLTLDVNHGNNSITTIIEGGVAPYIFSWTKNGAYLTDERNILNASPTTYCVEITDAVGCFIQRCVELCEPIEDKISFTVNPPCSFSNNGSICFDANLDDFIIQWQDGTIGPCLENVGTGTYYAQITDLKCNQKIIKAIDTKPYIPSYASLDVNIDVSNVACPGSEDEQICVEASGGKAPFIYQWEDGSTGTCLQNVEAGQCYSVTVTDACGSTITKCFELSTYTPLTIVGESLTDACNTGTNGAISIKVTGGKRDYFYSWTGPDGYTNNTIFPTIDNLETGEYFVTVTDACGNTVSSSYVVQGFAGPETYHFVDTEIIPACSETEGKGEINVIIQSDPGSPLTYQWSNGATSEDISNLLPGIYVLTVTDDFGCRNIRAFEVPISPVSIDEFINHICPGESDGRIIANLNTGFGPATYLWNTGSSSYFIDNLSTGNYSVTATDARGCTASKAYDFSPITFEVTGVVENACNGKIDITVNSVPSGYIPTTYNWSNGSTNEDLVGLAAGDYQVTVSNTDGCEGINSFTVQNEFEPPQIYLAGVQSATNPSTQDGSINIEIHHGKEPYTAYWSNGTTDEDIQGIRSGSYSVTVTDARGCTDNISPTLNHCNNDDQTFNDPEPFNLDAIVTPISVSGGNDGSLELIVQGGADLPRYYEWTGPNGYKAYTSSISNLSEGEYCVTVTDGCYTASLCRLIVFCGDYSPNHLAMDIAMDKPCNFLGATETQKSGGLVVTSIGDSFYQPYGTVSYFWEERKNDIWYEAGNDDGVTTIFPGYYRVTVSDLTTCTAMEEIFLEWGIMEGANNGFSPGLSTCSREVRCNGGCISCTTENTEIKFEVHSFVPCSGVVVCPIDNQEQEINGMMQGTPQIGEESVVYPGYCTATVGCVFTFEETDENTGEPVIIQRTETHNFLIRNDQCASPPSDPNQYGNGDFDGDGIPDKDDDNCDGPDIDTDGDGIRDNCDNCPNYYNPSQSESDFDGVGDACDMCPGIDNSGDPAAASVDTDGDGVYDGCDNCKLTSNPEQCDIDGDGEGDACDLDACIVYDNNPDLQCCDEVALISDEGDVIPRQDRPIIPNNSKIGIQNIYPNPFSNQLNIDIRSDIDQEIELFILDVLGNPILLTKEKVTKGRNLISIDMDKNNATGVYTVKIRDKDGNEDNQLVVRIRR